MRDYKNVKVPKRYRTETTRSIKRSAVTRRVSSPAPSSDLWRSSLRFLLIILIAGGTYLGWVGYQWFAHTEIFQISGVDVRGVQRLSEDEVRQIGGIFAGHNIFLVNIDAAARQARRHPWVKDVQIHRQLPNRISMFITERVPAAVLDTGNAKHLLDGEGVVIERISRRTGEALPLVLAQGAQVSNGEQVSAKGVPEAMDVLAELSARKGWQLSEVTIRAESPESLSVLYAGHEFKMGKGGYAEKLRRLGEIVADMHERGRDFAYVDLRPERQAAVMVRR